MTEGLEELLEQSKTTEWELEKTRATLEEELRQTSALQQEIARLEETLASSNINPETPLTDLRDEEQTEKRRLAESNEINENLKTLLSLSESLVGETDKATCLLETLYRSNEDLAVCLDSVFVKMLTEKSETFTSEDINEMFQAKVKHQDLLDGLCSDYQKSVEETAPFLKRNSTVGSPFLPISKKRRV